MRRLFTGNEAAVEAVKLAGFDFVPAYPITPSTSIVEGLAKVASQPGNGMSYLTVESEFSVMAAAMGAASAGADVFTATSSQGLAYMHELLHWVSGARLPVVMAIANRAIGYPWNIHADESDSLSQRDTGWMQFYCENSQDVFDFIIMAKRLADEVRLPVMVCMDGFYVSHTSEPVEVPEVYKVRKFLQNDYGRKTSMLDTEAPTSFGNPVSPEDYARYRTEHARAFEIALNSMISIGEEFYSSFHRHVEPLEVEMMDHAEIAVISMGSTCTSARSAVKDMRSRGEKVCFVKLNAFRPFPAQLLADAVNHLKEIIVVERDMVPGSGGIVTQEVRAALAETGVANIRVSASPMGIGGADISTKNVVKAVEDRLC